MGCRKNQANLTPAEKTAFVNAVLALKAKPSQLHPGDLTSNRYDDYVEVHMNAMMLPNGNPRVPGWAHRGPAFFPWHRELLRRFELDLQAIDPSVTLPYWDWTVNNSSDPVPGSPWTDDFMGQKNPNDDKVISGPFRAGSWTLNVREPGDNDPDLRRALGRAQFQQPNAQVSALPTSVQVNGPTGALTVTPYDITNWSTSAQPSFRNRAEGWYGLGSIHNRVHLWVAGSMLPSTSPNDPIFFMHHCNVDRLWALWQQQHPTEAYHPSGVSPELAPTGHNLNDVMIFNDTGQPAPWAGSATVASMLNHHVLGYWYDTDPVEVTLTTPSIAFTDIPEGIGGTGVTTYRAVRFEVMSCSEVHLEIIAGPTAGFGTPLGLTATVPPTHQAPPAIGRLWISYTSTTAMSSITGSVTVRVVETGQTWVVNLSANTVARPKSAVVLVLDRSGSMSDDAGDGQRKVDKLREAVSTFVTVMLPGDGLGIVRFDDTVQRLMSVTDVGPVTPVMPGSGRDQANAIVTGNQLDPAGATSIGGGVAEGKLALDTAPATLPPYSVRAMLVLTDGEENTAPMIADVSSSITANTFAIGFGTPANISTAALNALTQNHNGYLVVTGGITPDQSLRLTKYFLQILAGITNANVVLDPHGELVFGAVHRIPFTMTEADMGMDVILLSPAPYYVEFLLETPDGQIIDPSKVGVEPAVSFVTRGQVSYYRVSLPALAASPAGSHAGQWYALLSLGKRATTVDAEFVNQLRSRSLPYNLLVHSYSNLQFKAAVQQKSFEPGAEVMVLASLSEYDVPVEKRAYVWAEVTRPDISNFTLSLQERDGGRFEAHFTALMPGLYTLRVRASGTTFIGRPFQREQTLTAAVYKGGDLDPNQGRGSSIIVDWLKDHDKRLCKLFLCLLSDAVIGSEMTRDLAAKGVNLKVLKECVQMYCHETERGAPEGDVSREPLEAPPGFNASQFLAQPEVRRAMNTLQRELRAAAEDTIGFAELQRGEPIRREIEERPAEIEKMLRGPMFDLSPEDKAAGEGELGSRGLEERPSGPTQEERHAGPMFDLSPEDKAAGEGEPGSGGSSGKRSRKHHPQSGDQS